MISYKCRGCLERRRLLEEGFERIILQKGRGRAERKKETKKEW